MRVIDCECGAVIQAGHEDDLRKRLREHLEENHPEREADDDTIRQMVAEKAYFATDS
jgi:predicted small metal-binding protein